MRVKLILVKLILVLSVASPLYPLSASAEISSMPEAINKAGRQRMLSQRMAKAYLMIGIDVDYEKAKDQLSSAVDLFDQQLQELSNYSPTAEVDIAIDEVEEKWLSVINLLDNPVSRDRVNPLLRETDDLLRLSHRVVLLLQDLSGSEQGRLVNIAGRQRMLTQRLSKYYMARMWGFKGAEITDETQRAQNEFKGALQELTSSSINTQELNKALKRAQQQWKLFENALEKKNQKIPLIVAINSEQLLVNMNAITGMYADLK